VRPREGAGAGGEGAGLLRTGGAPSRSGGVLATLFRYEIKMLLRDKRTILIAVVAPLVILPAYILLMNLVESREQRALEEKVYHYAVTGTLGEWAGEVVDAALALEATATDTTRLPATFELLLPDAPEEALGRGELHLVVQGLTPGEWDSVQAAEEPAGYGSDSSPEEEDAASPAVPAIRILFRAESDFSREARSRLTERILEVRVMRRDSVYRSAGFPVDMEAVVPVEAVSVSTLAREAGAFLGLALTPLLVLLMLSGGSIVAVDAISGEKERGTLETLLTTAASRTEIVNAKLLSVIMVGLAVAVLNVTNLLVYLVMGLLELPSSLAVEVGPLELVALLLLFIPLAVLVAAALLLLSGVAKTYKEFQVYFFPVFLVFLVPTLAPALPGVELRSVVALVPLAGVAVGVKEILMGKMDLLFLPLAFLSTGAAAVWLIRLTQSALSNEKLISGADLDAADLAGGAALFPRHVLRWFMVLWVILFLGSLWLGDMLELRGQLVLNLVVIFFGGSLIMVRRYRLDPVAAFHLKVPHPSAWLAVALGAPSALVLGVGLAQLVNTYVFPVPEEILRTFAQGLTGTDFPLWQVILFLSIMPGVFEELAFRGVLLHGLRQRIRSPWLLALAVGGIFGLFHMSLFRLVPTAFLGVVFAWSVLLSGSVLPAVLWHALNNALSVVPVHMGLLPEDFTPQSWWALPAALGLMVSMWILWRGGRSRTGSPG
jgi:sodium transport system permease protein